jgi:hypothetical protein
MTKRLVLVGLLVFCIFGLRPWRIFAQAGAGYVKIASTNGFSQFDTAVTAGQVWNYEITAVNASGESGPSNVVTVIIPAAPSTSCGAGIAHCVNLSWSASVVDATHSAALTYNVYREQVVLANPPVVNPPTTP